MRKVDEAKTEERRRHILKAALACFQRSGFHGASISDICREAGMTASHLYYYFDSKDALIEAVAEEDRQSSHLVYEWLHGRDDLLETYLVRRDEPDRGPLTLSSALTFETLSEASRNERIASMLDRYMQTTYPILEKLVAEAQARGEIDPDLDTALVARFVGTVSAGQRALKVSAGGYDVAAIGRLVQTLLAPKKTVKKTARKAAKKTAAAARRRT